MLCRLYIGPLPGAAGRREEEWCWWCWCWCMVRLWAAGAGAQGIVRCQDSRNHFSVERATPTIWHRKTASNHAVNEDNLTPTRQSLLEHHHNGIAAGRERQESIALHNAQEDATGPCWSVSKASFTTAESSQHCLTTPCSWNQRIDHSMQTHALQLE